MKLLLLKLKEYVPVDETLYHLITRLEYKIEGYAYCEICDAYFPRKFKYCPNCGGTINYSKNKVLNNENQTHPYLIPFPNLDLLKEGTFDLTKGVSADQVRKLRLFLANAE